MKTYYVNNKQVTEAEAKEIIARNEEYINSGDPELWLKCEFIIAINNNETN